MIHAHVEAVRNIRSVMGLSDMEAVRPKVALSVIVLKDGKVLLGKRIGGGGADGMFGTPGGHLEHMESFEQCIHRELKEEVDIEVENIRFVCVTNVTHFPPRHYVLLSFVADWKSGDAILCEPDRCAGWDWFDVDQLPTPMTPATESGLVALKNGQLFFDKEY